MIHTDFLWLLLHNARPWEVLNHENYYYYYYYYY